MLKSADDLQGLAGMRDTVEIQRGDGT